MSENTSVNEQARPEWYDPKVVVLFCDTLPWQRTPKYRDGVEGRVLRRWFNGDVKKAHEASVRKLLWNGFDATLNDLEEWAARNGVSLYTE